MQKDIARSGKLRDRLFGILLLANCIQNCLGHRRRCLFIFPSLLLCLFLSVSLFVCLRLCLCLCRLEHFFWCFICSHIRFFLYPSPKKGIVTLGPPCTTLIRAPIDPYKHLRDSFLIYYYFNNRLKQKPKAARVYNRR